MAARGSVAFLGMHLYERHGRRKTTRRASSVLLGHKVETKSTAGALIVGRDKESARNFALELSRENSATIARALISRRLKHPDAIFKRRVQLVTCDKLIVREFFCRLLSLFSILFNNIFINVLFLFSHFFRYFLLIYFNNR